MEEEFVIITVRNANKCDVMDFVFDGIQYEQVGKDVDIWAYPEQVECIANTLKEKGMDYVI